MIETNNESNENKESSFKIHLRETWSFLLDILYNAAIIIILVILIRNFLVSPFRVVGNSMLDTLFDKEFILIDKFSYLVGDIDRGDPIVFLPPIMSTDSPKFEKTLQTDKQGKGELELEGLEGLKMKDYCANKFLASLWVCVEKPKKEDHIYFAPTKNGKTDWSAVERFSLSKKDLKEGSVVIHGEPNKSYTVRIYNPEGPEYFVKRVIGVPGDTVMIKEELEKGVKKGIVYIKGPKDADFKRISESFLNAHNFEKTFLDNPKKNTFVVPEGEYFVIGDNRQGSNDSRSWREPITEKRTPFVPKKNIAGKVLIVLWPLNHLRFIHGVDF